MKNHPRFHVGLMATAGFAALALALGGCSSSGNDPEPTETSSGGSTGSLADMLPDEIKDAGVLKLGSPVTNPPYIFKPDGTNLEGIFPELANAVGEELGVEIEFVETAFPGLVPALQANRVDALWTVMNDTVEREETLDFVDYIKTSSSMMVLKGNPKGIKGIEDLCGNIGATLRGALQIPLMEEQSTKCTDAGKEPVEILLYDAMDEGLTQLRAGKFDAYFGGTVPFTYIAATADGGETFEVVKDAEYLGGAFGVVTEKQDTQLRDAILAALQEIERKGTYGEVLKKYDAESSALTADEMIINGKGAGAFD